MLDVVPMQVNFPSAIPLLVAVVFLLLSLKLAKKAVKLIFTLAAFACIIWFVVPMLT